MSKNIKHCALLGVMTKHMELKTVKQINKHTETKVGKNNPVITSFNNLKNLI